MIKILVALLSLFVAWYLKEVVFLVFLSFLLSATATYTADLLHKRYNLTRTGGIVLVFVSFVTLIAATLILLIPAVITEGYSFANNVPRLLFDIQQDLNNAGFVLNLGVSTVQDIVDIFPVVKDNAVTLFQQVFEILTFAFLAVMLSFYIAMDPEALNKIVSLFAPRRYRNNVELFLQKSRMRLGNWALSQVTIAITTGIFLYTILAMTQVRYAILLSLLWAVSEIIPFIGPLLASIPVLILSFSVSPIFGFAILLCLIIIQIIKFTLLIPIFIDKKARLNPFAVLISLMIGGTIAGPFGVIIATPVISMLTLLKDDLERYVNLDDTRKITSK